MARRQILIACPAKPGTRYGNRVTALRWQAILRRLGHRVRIADCVGDKDDLLVALHARRSAHVILESKQRVPQRPVVVAITGTDLYRDGDKATTKRSLQLADRLVVLQPAAVGTLPSGCRRKAVTIYQSVKPLNVGRPTRPRRLRVVVAGHLRTVKDPLRAEMATRSLPKESRIVVEHFGAALDPQILRKAENAAEKNPRYALRGEVSRAELRRRLATCWLMVLSSRMEGGANVLSEAIVQRTPVLASRIDGSVGLLGDAYRGYFDVANTRQLRELLLRCETDTKFYRRLTSQVTSRAQLFSPERERQSWKELLAQLF